MHLDAKFYFSGMGCSALPSSSLIDSAYGAALNEAAYLLMLLGVDWHWLPGAVHTAVLVLLCPPYMGGRLVECLAGLLVALK